MCLPSNHRFGPQRPPVADAGGHDDDAAQEITALISTILENAAGAALADGTTVHHSTHPFFPYYHHWDAAADELWVLLSQEDDDLATPTMAPSVPSLEDLVFAEIERAVEGGEEILVPPRELFNSFLWYIGEFDWGGDMGYAELGKAFLVYCDALRQREARAMMSAHDDADQL
jgi:hypothetical protein